MWWEERRGSSSQGEEKGGKEERGKRDVAMDHRFSLVQGKFIGTLARIHVICLAVHWSLGYISLPLQSVQLDKRAGGLSNLQQPGTGSRPSYIFQMKFTISITDLSHYMDKSGFQFLTGKHKAHDSPELLKGKTTSNLADSK